MSNTPTFLGISMGPQKNRRLLVAATYTILVALAAVLVTRPSWIRGLGPLGHLFLNLTVLLFALFPILFSNLAKLPLPLSSPSGSGGMTRLGLKPGPRDPDDLDERQVAVRNAAHHHAFRIIAVLALVLFGVLVYLDEMHDANVHRLMVGLVILMVFLVLSLPPAIVLWMEPDAPGEDQR